MIGQKMVQNAIVIASVSASDQPRGYPISPGRISIAADAAYALVMAPAPKSSQPPTMSSVGVRFTRL
jgi:hypothetical protein